MPTIQRTLGAFTKNLEANKIIVCKKDSWHVENPLIHLIKKCLLRESSHSRVLGIGNLLSKEFDRLETIPVIVSKNSRIIEAKKKIYGPYFKAAEKVQNILRPHLSRKAIKNISEELLQKVTALSYRLERTSLEAEPAEILEKQLLAHAESWKGSIKQFPDKTLTLKNREKIKEAAAYASFAKNLIANKGLRENFFKWSLRDNNSVKLFVEYPALTTRLKATHLSSRIGRFVHSPLSIEENTKKISGLSVQEKDVFLPFYDGKQSRKISILNEEKDIQLKNWKTTLKCIMDGFKDKNWKPGDFELFETVGIANWNCHQIGSWNGYTNAYERIDLNLSNWWTQLPIVQIYKQEDLEKKYDLKLKEGEWILAVNATRETIDLDLDGRHGYVEVFVPLQDGSYGLYPFGKFAAKFPQGKSELLKFLVDTVESKIAFPDENIYYTHRQHASYPVIINAEEGNWLMELIAKDLVKARSGDLFFAFGGDNCSGWAQQLFENLMKKRKEESPQNLFLLELLESHPRNVVLKFLFAIFRKAPKRIQPYLLKGLDRLLGSANGITIYENGVRVFKSLATSPYRQKNIIFQPGYLHQQIQERKIKGILFSGH